jgi:hypothetical protein
MKSITPPEMLHRIRSLVESERLTPGEIKKTLNVQLAPDSPHRYIAASAREPIATECPPLRSGVVQRFLLLEDYERADLFIPFREGFALTDTMLARTADRYR